MQIVHRFSTRGFVLCNCLSFVYGSYLFLSRPFLSASRQASETNPQTLGTIRPRTYASVTSRTRTNAGGARYGVVRPPKHGRD